MALAATVPVEATQWVFLMSARDLSYAVDMDSVSTGPTGLVEYIGKTTWKKPAMLSGATKPVAVSITRYQVNCDRKAWRALNMHHLAADGTSAGALRPSETGWSAIGPGTVVDLMFRRVC